MPDNDTKHETTIGAEMQLSFVKIAIPGCKDLLGPLTRCNTQVTFLAPIPGGRKLHWMFSYASKSTPVFEDPLLKENLPKEHVEGETAEEKCGRLNEHNLRYVEYHMSFKAQEELGAMLKEAMDDNMFSKPLFPRFLELAPELQDIIWDKAMEEERIIEVHFWKRCAKWVIIDASTDAKNPTVLSVCKAARARGLRKYKALTVDNSWRRDKEMYDDRQRLLGLPLDFVGSEAATTNFNCYINYESDTIFINTDHSRAYTDALLTGEETWREDFGYQYLKDLFFSSAGDQIKNLAIDYRVAEKWLNTGRKNWQYCQVLAAMPQLSKLAVAWTDHKGLEEVVEKDCCGTEFIVIEPGQVLTNDERYGMSFPCDGEHRRAKSLKDIENIAVDLEEDCAFRRFVSGKTPSTWKANMTVAVRENRPRNPADYILDSFHFINGKSRYRDLDELEISQVFIEREEKLTA